MRGTFFKCKNRVVIEGLEIGSAATIEMSEDRDSLANSCTITLPFYAIGYVPGFATQERVRVALENAQIRPGATIQIYTSYYDDPVIGNTFTEILQFSGFVKQVIDGFPTTIICEDMAFILRSGTINRDWRSATTIRQVIEYIAPIANDAFLAFREKQGFAEPDNFTKLYYDSTNSADVVLALQVWKGVAPYDALSHMLKLFTLYGNVADDGAVYFGVGILDKFKRTVQLATNTNVIERKIVPRNRLFENFKVIVNGLVEGRRYTFELGDSQAQPEKVFSPLNTVTGIQQYARSVMYKLKGDRNSGTITTILYPHVKLFDFVEYTDTLFPNFSGSYYVIGRSFTANSSGFRQVLTVTDEVFIL